MRRIDRRGFGWAWEILDTQGNWVMCSWCVASRAVLEEDGKPSPEAKPVQVQLVPTRASVRKRQRERMYKDDKPGNIHWTGDVEFNALQKRIGTKRFSPSSAGMVEDDNGQYVGYHNFCAAIRTKVSTIHANNDYWTALVILAHYIEPKLMQKIVAAHIEKHPAAFGHIDTAFKRSRDDWHHYE